MDKSEKLYNGLEDRLHKLDQKVELGPPGLWKLTAQVRQMRQGARVRQMQDRSGCWQDRGAPDVWGWQPVLAVWECWDKARRGWGQVRWQNARGARSTSVLFSVCATLSLTTHWIDFIIE